MEVKMVDRGSLEDHRKVLSQLLPLAELGLSCLVHTTIHGSDAAKQFYKDFEASIKEAYVLLEKPRQIKSTNVHTNECWMGAGCMGHEED